jgi:hypothetical protein
MVCYYQPEHEYKLQNNSNIIIGCHIGAYASSMGAQAIGMYLGGTETSVHACHIDALSCTGNVVGVEITGRKNNVQDCTIRSEICSPAVDSTSVGLRVDADEQSISTCNIQASGNAKACLITSGHNNVASCTITGTCGSTYGMVLDGNECVRNIVVNNIIRGPFAVGILLGEDNVGAPQATLCKNNAIDGFDTSHQSSSAIGIKCYGTAIDNPNYIENNSICNCDTGYVDAGSAGHNFFVRNVTYTTSYPFMPPTESMYENLSIPHT